MDAAGMLVSNKQGEWEELNGMVPDLYDGEVGPDFSLQLGQWIEAAGEGQFDKLMDCDTGEVCDGRFWLHPKCPATSFMAAIDQNGR
nr:hypothetical protein Itr_chr03CG01940 [Ipomoea trifida]